MASSYLGSEPISLPMDGAIGPAKLICLAMAIVLHSAIFWFAYDRAPAPVAQPLPITLSARWAGESTTAKQPARKAAPTAKPAAKQVRPASPKKALNKKVSKPIVKPVAHAAAKPAGSAVSHQSQTPSAMPVSPLTDNSSNTGSSHSTAPTGSGSQHATTGSSAPIARDPSLHNPEPPYPYESRSRGEEGRVILKVRVNADGTASSVEIDQSSGYYRLDREARRTVSRWRFIPGKQNNVAIAAWARVTIIFQIRG